MTATSPRSADHAARDDIRRALEAVIPASRSIRPYDYIEPRRSYDGHVLETKSGLLIGGALPRRPAAANDGTYECAAVELTADAIAIQAALTDRRADKPRLIDEVRAFAHELRTDVRVARRVRARLYDLTVKPVLRWL
jgi:hypothetical protein